MKTIGLDIGTTKICGILIDSESGELLLSRSCGNESAIADALPWEKCQNPEEILSCCRKILGELFEAAGGKAGFVGAADRTAGDIVSIGITGQMHGILYLDADGNAVSPLYTWQDGRGGLPFSDKNTYASYLTRKTGYKMATGFGLTTHFYMVHNDLVPENADVFCTIHDFVAMKLVHAAAPLVHTSDAASFGLFDIEKNSFDLAAVELAGINPLLLPAVTKDSKVVGRTPEGIPVSVAIGDNQASFLGSVNEPDAILVNVGTGGQVSARVSDVSAAEGIEVRPLTGNDRLCVGSPLCGGYSYAVLKEFFTQAAALSGAEKVPSDLYKRMDAAAQEVYSAENPLQVDTRFCGTRENPQLRGRIENISPSNLTPGHICLGFLRGVAGEFHSLYRKIPAESARTTLIGSGNGIRNSPLMQQIFSDTFGLALKIPLYQEEAAYGAALFSLVSAGIYSSFEQAQSKIRYQ